MIVLMAVHIQHKAKNKELEDLYMAKENQEFLQIHLYYQKLIY